MIYLLDGNKVEVESYITGEGYMQIECAYYTATEEDLTDDEIYQLEEKYMDHLSELYFENQVAAAEYYYEGDR